MSGVLHSESAGAADGRPVQRLDRRHCMVAKGALPELVLAGTIVLQLAAGLMVVLGWHARVGAAVLLVFSVVATLIAHNPFGRKADDFRREAMLSLEHLAIVGGLLLIVARGPGAIALMP